MFLVLYVSLPVWGLGFHVVFPIQEPTYPKSPPPSLKTEAPPLPYCPHPTSAPAPPLTMQGHL